LPLLPRHSSLIAWIIGGLTAAGLSLFVYPMDVGLLDANPVQVLYTGQWAQRLGVAMGLLCILCFFRSLQAVEADFRLALRHAITAAIFLGASLFSHYMSGFAAAAVVALLAVHNLVARRLTQGKWQFLGLLIFPIMLPICLLLFADFFYVFVSLNSSYHNLPLLKWEVPLGALATIKEIMIPALPIILIPTARSLAALKLKHAGLTRLAFPLVVLVHAGLASTATLLPFFIIIVAAALVASWQEKEFCARHWLPVSAFFLMLLACGPESLNLFGLDLTALIPFNGSIGWAKLAAFSRFLFLAWFGILVAEGLSAGPRRGRLAGRLAALTLTIIGLLVPLLLSIDSTERTGAQSFFAAIEKTDRDFTAKVFSRISGKAMGKPRDGYLLVEDTLHHAPASELENKNLPNGHIPYLAGPNSRRPVLGGTPTTRYITHPLAHTSRGQLMCVDYDAAGDQLNLALDQLRKLGVAEIMAHSPKLIEKLDSYPSAELVNQQAGLTHYRLADAQPILTDKDGQAIDQAGLNWYADLIEVKLPKGVEIFRLRQVYLPLLGCEANGPSGERGCFLTSWSQGSQTFSGCLVDDPRSITVEIPWIQARVEPDPKGPVIVKISSQPPLFFFIIMIIAWVLALYFRHWLKHKGKKKIAAAVKSENYE